MGYTTTFKGAFKFDKEPTVKVLKQISEVYDPDECETEYAQPFPDSYCQWQLTKQLDGIEWDRGEKFYKYTEWLQWIIDNILKPAKISIRGRVEFQGEESTDFGVLVVEDDQHVRIENPPLVSDDIDELRAFRDFVMADRDAGDLIQRWRRMKANRKGT